MRSWLGFLLLVCGLGAGFAVGEQLGEGEVNARLSVMGLTEVIETGFPGVWLISHYNADEVIVGRFVEICAAPEILKSQTDDIRAGLQDLEEALSNAETRA